eukprot:7879234-Alexandrium_andersonii.AAC.1
MNEAKGGEGSAVFTASAPVAQVVSRTPAQGSCAGWCSPHALERSLNQGGHRKPDSHTCCVAHTSCVGTKACAHTRTAVHVP